MELFTLGEGHYSEQDIKEAARAFTGWSLDRETGTFVFRRVLHDAGVKTVLGTRGRFDGDAVLDIILARPQTREFITAKLWREFVSPDPDPREVERIAADLPRPGLRHQGRAARAADLRRVLGDATTAARWSSRRSSSSSARCASSRSRPAARCRSRSRRGHGPEPVLAAQRQGLARRRAWINSDDAARAQAVPRPPRAHGRQRRRR